MVIETNPSKTKIPISPAIEDCNPKNKYDQARLAINCNPKRSNAIFFFSGSFLYFCGCDQIRYSEIPIKIYRAVQAIGKTMFGGVIGGLIKDSYQDPGPVTVAKEPKKPTPKQNAIASINLI